MFVTAKTRGVDATVSRFARNTVDSIIRAYEWYLLL